MLKLGVIPPNFGLSSQFLLELNAMKNELPASNGFKIIVLVGAFAFLVLVNHLGNRLGESKWMKRPQEKLSGNAKLRTLGPFLYVPLFFAVIMVIPVAIGEIMRKKQAQ